MLSRTATTAGWEAHQAVRKMEEEARFNRDAAIMALMQHQDLHTLARRIGPQSEDAGANPRKLVFCAW